MGHGFVCTSRLAASLSHGRNASGAVLSYDLGGSGGSDQAYIRQSLAGVSGESDAQEIRANKRTSRIVGVRKALGISIRPIPPFHRLTRP